MQVRTSDMLKRKRQANVDECELESSQSDESRAWQPHFSKRSQQT